MKAKGSCDRYLVFMIVIVFMIVLQAAGDVVQHTRWAALAVQHWHRCISWSRSWALGFQLRPCDNVRAMRLWLMQRARKSMDEWRPLPRRLVWGLLRPDRPPRTFSGEQACLTLSFVQMFTQALVGSFAGGRAVSEPTQLWEPSHRSAAYHDWWVDNAGASLHEQRPDAIL